MSEGVPEHVTFKTSLLLSLDNDSIRNSIRSELLEDIRFAAPKLLVSVEVLKKRGSFIITFRVAPTIAAEPLISGAVEN